MYITFSLIYKSYLKEQIKKEEQRIEEEKAYVASLYDEDKTHVYYKMDISEGIYEVTFQIDFNKKNVQKITYSAGGGLRKYNIFILWDHDKNTLEDLQSINRTVTTKNLTDTENQELEELINKVLDENKTLEEYRKELEERKQNLSKIYISHSHPDYTISTLDKKDVVMDNNEDIETFIKILADVPEENKNSPLKELFYYNW